MHVITGSSNLAALSVDVMHAEGVEHAKSMGQALQILPFGHP